MNSIPLLFGHRRVAGSAIAGIAQTQEVLHFCTQEHPAEVEMICMDQINEAHERLERYRFVIDMASLTEPEDAAS